MEALKSFISKIPYPYKIYFFFDIIILFCLIISLLLELVIKSFIGVFFYLLIILIPNGLNFLVNFLTKYDYSSFYGFKIIWMVFMIMSVPSNNFLTKFFYCFSIKMLNIGQWSRFNFIIKEICWIYSLTS